MAQYQLYSSGDYIYYSDTIDDFREGNRNGYFVTDKALTSTGFSGVENIDWENIAYAGSGGSVIYRDGVRSTYFVLDVTLTETGFSGVENTDWECIRSYPET